MYIEFNEEEVTEARMATNLLQTSKKLMQALNSHGYMLTFSMRQFMGREKKPINMYSINKAIWNEDTQKYYHNELYSTTSMLRIVLYLRDMWYEENGWELPTDQPLWNEIRAKLREDSNG